jgi:hypothetical protein
MCLYFPLFNTHFFNMNSHNLQQEEELSLTSDQCLGNIEMQEHLYLSTVSSFHDMTILLHVDPLLGNDSETNN